MADRSGRGHDPSRRKFLAGLGVTAAGVAASSVGGVSSVAAMTGTATGAISPPGGHAGVPSDSGSFGRMFPSLPPFADANDTVRGALVELGKPGGILDAHDDLSAGPKRLITDASVNGNPTAADPYGTNPDNPTMTAGSTFIGQFTDHDITFDQTSQLGVPQDPLASPNTRTPALDLDSVFGGGPGRRPDLYVSNPDGTVGPKLKIGTGGVHEDVPRVANGDGTYGAFLGDPRNDENVVIAGLHCAHILFYNRVIDSLDEHRPAGLSVRERRGPFAWLPRVLGGTRSHALALPMVAGQRTPAPDRRPSTRRRHPRPRKSLLLAATRSSVHANRVRRSRLPLRAQHGPTLISRQLHQRHRRQHRPDQGSVLRAGLRPEPVRLQRAHHQRPR